MAKFRPVLAWLFFVSIASIFFSFLPIRQQHQQRIASSTLGTSLCNYSAGSWVLDQGKRARYGQDCPFHRNAWNCVKNSRPGMDKLVAWRWVPDQCLLRNLDPPTLLSSIRNKNVGFIGDSLNENFLVALLCTLQAADPDARKWKHKGAWRGAYFPRFNVTIAYHRAVLLAHYTELQDPATLKQLRLKKAYRVDVDVPAWDWSDILEFYDVFVFNTGHWWNTDKFPSSSPLLFYERGKLVTPPLGLRDGLSVVLSYMVAHIEQRTPPRALKLWRMQSPRHFEGGDWNQNGTCTSDTLLSNQELDLWFRSGVNTEAREINQIIRKAITGTTFHVFDITHLTEYRQDAHPAIWLGRKDAHLVWGQDCMHWCLPGVPDTWVDILADIILNFFGQRN